MCGIVGYIGPRDATPIVLGGLKRLEYRGYDSAGLAVIQDGRIEIRRDAGKLSRLTDLVNGSPIHGTPGIGHTRWATHGVPSMRNAHPHLGLSGRVVLVHNGIVENFLDLRRQMISEGITFNSDTDTEVIVHLIEKSLASGLPLKEAAREAFKNIIGAHAIVVISSTEPDKIICARIGNAGGIVIGLGEGENFVASDVPAILEHTRKMIFLESHQMAVVSAGGYEIETLQGGKVKVKPVTIAWDASAAEKGEYRHFMHKEIHEQVRSLTETMAGRVDFSTGTVLLPELNLNHALVKKIDKIIITACGTAAYAGMIGKNMIETIARIPCQMEIASEFRYSDPIINDRTVVLAISQSGETADTLAAMEEAKRKKAILWSIVNAVGSQAMRIADGSISMQTGPEIGVASTKAFTAPLVDQYLLAILLGQLRGTLKDADRKRYVGDLRLIPDAVSRALMHEAEIELIAEELKEVHDCLYLGRGINMAIAYEGALKLKEISYIHAEGYPAGEMKHGPIALVDENMPVVCIAPRDPWREKMVSQIQQVKARGGRVIAVATEGDEVIASMADRVLWVPECPWTLSPIVTIIPLQLLAYHIAVNRGLDVDQPRNLAKSVTVE